MPSSDARHFKSLIEPHLEALFRAAFRLARNKADAEDLVQETCVRACRGISELDESRHVKAWLLRVLHNVFVDAARRARRSPVTTLETGTDPGRYSPSTEPGPEESACRSQREEQLERAWLKLDRGQRVLLALRAEGYGLSEISAVTSVPLDALNARLYRARQSFARYLRDEETDQCEDVEIAK
jgi:RNA polymerase sigma-70 factor (ECF subfamily)